MRIGELAEISGVPSRTIRYYERRGLLAEPERETNGYRNYDDTTVNRLAFVRNAQSAGLTLVEIRSILDIRDDGAVPCAHVSDLLKAKSAAVTKQIAHLAVLQAEIDLLVQRSRQLDPPTCTAGEICQILQPAQ